MRFLLRLIGFLLLAAGFVGIVIDGTRSIANAGLEFTTIGQMVQLAYGAKFAGLQSSVESVHPFLWDPVLRNTFVLPAGIVAFVLGAILLWLGRKPEEPVGYLAGP